MGFGWFWSIPLPGGRTGRCPYLMHYHAFGRLTTGASPKNAGEYGGKGPRRYYKVQLFGVGIFHGTDPGPTRLLKPTQTAGVPVAEEQTATTCMTAAALLHVVSCDQSACRTSMVLQVINEKEQKKGTIAYQGPHKPSKTWFSLAKRKRFLYVNTFFFHGLLRAPGVEVCGPCWQSPRSSQETFPRQRLGDGQSSGYEVIGGGE